MLKVESLKVLRDIMYELFSLSFIRNTSNTRKQYQWRQLLHRINDKAFHNNNNVIIYFDQLAWYKYNEIQP